MVVICAAVVSRSGRILLGRALTSLSRVRLEGYLQSFPKLVGPDAQHTFVETDSVRYVYQPMESIFVVLITTKQSNIMEDLETLRSFAKLLPEYCGGTSEDHVAARVFELTFAVDELLTHGGYRENVTLQQIKTFTEMDSHEEKLQKIIMESKMNQARDEARRKASDIDQQKAQMRQAMAMAGGGGGGGGGAGGKYSSYGSDNAPQRDSYGGGGDYGRSAESVSPPEPSPSKLSKKPTESAGAGGAAKGKVKGMQLSKAKKTDDFFAQLNKEEKMAPPTGKVGPMAGGAGAAAAAAGAASSSSPAVKQSVRVLLEEKVVCVLDREGGIKKLEIKGEMKLSIFDPDDARILVLTNGPLQERDGFKCRLHPKINKQLWASSGTLGLGDATKSFPVGSDNAPIILKWRKESTSDSDIPLTLNFWPNVENGQTVVSVEYSAENAAVDLHNVLVQIPCSQSRDAPDVTACEGDFSFDHKAKVLNWRIPHIGSDNKSGALEFSVPEVDGDSFFPIEVSFDSSSTLSQIRITGVVQAEDEEAQVKFDEETQMSVEKYTVE